jgi:phosphatidylinositol glycan class V
MEINYRLIKYGVISRLIVNILSLLSYLVCPSYDTSTELLILNGSKASNSILTDWVLSLIKWDSIYFLKISKYGYVYENYLAFFPGLPFTIKFINSALGLEDSIINLSIVGLVLSNISFLISIQFLFNLSLKVVKNKKLSFLACVLYTFNPSSAIFSSIYTESSFNMLSFLGMYLLSIDNDYLAAFTWALAGLVRSNSIIYSGFFVYKLVFKAVNGEYKGLLAKVLHTMLLVSITLSSFIWFQYYAYTQFCSGKSSAESSEWCSGFVSYTYIQTKYWNNGFLKYWTLQQLPNFLLAAPFLLLSILGLFNLLKNNWLNFVSLKLLRIRQSENSDNKKSNNTIGNNNMASYINYLLILSFRSCLSLK